MCLICVWCMQATADIGTAFHRATSNLAQDQQSSRQGLQNAVINSDGLNSLGGVQSTSGGVHTSMPWDYTTSDDSRSVCAQQQQKVVVENRKGGSRAVRGGGSRNARAAQQPAWES